MKNKIWLVLVIILTSCSAPVASTMLETEPQALSTATLYFTPTQAGTPTPDWQSAYSVAATNERASNMTLEATNLGLRQADIAEQAEKNEADRITLANRELDTKNTEIAASMTIVSVNATGSAYPTSVPLTATQQVISNTQTPAEVARIANEPTIVFANAQSAAYADKADEILAVELVVKLAFSTLFIALALLVFVVMWRWNDIPKKQLPKPVEQVQYPRPAASTLESSANFIKPSDTHEPSTVSVAVVNKTNPAYPSADYKVFPCTAKMLSEWAYGITSGTRSTKINDWEGRETLWTRKSYTKWRQWLYHSKLADFGAVGELVIPEDGKLMQILYDWLDKHQLPEGYEFTEDDVENKNTDLPINILEGIDQKEAI